MERKRKAMNDVRQESSAKKNPALGTDDEGAVVKVLEQLNKKNPSARCPDSGTATPSEAAYLSSSCNS